MVAGRQRPCPLCRPPAPAPWTSSLVHALLAPLVPLSLTPQCDQLWGCLGGQGGWGGGGGDTGPQSGRLKPTLCLLPLTLWTPGRWLWAVGVLTGCLLPQAPRVCRAGADPGGPPPALCAGLQPDGARVEAGLWEAGVVRQPGAEVRGSRAGAGAVLTPGSGWPGWGHCPRVRAACTPDLQPLL